MYVYHKKYKISLIIKVEYFDFENLFKNLNSYKHFIKFRVGNFATTTRLKVFK